MFHRHESLRTTTLTLAALALAACATSQEPAPRYPGGATVGTVLIGGNDYKVVSEDSRTSTSVFFWVTAPDAKGQPMKIECPTYAYPPGNTGYNLSACKFVLGPNGAPVLSNDTNDTTEISAEPFTPARDPNGSSRLETPRIVTPSANTLAPQSYRRMLQAFHGDGPRWPEAFRIELPVGTLGDEARAEAIMADAHTTCPVQDLGDLFATHFVGRSQSAGFYDVYEGGGASFICEERACDVFSQPPTCTVYGCVQTQDAGMACGPNTIPGNLHPPYLRKPVVRPAHAQPVLKPPF